ncbi:hypothetical protein [Gemmiger formicilis]|uniref:hypothetical protein n=1 Tax=Gemmiger formicilis TaxID=745368 RepID=UPI00241D6B5E|nr:hypothetical protein [Gemmiger formicilis]
MKKRLVSIILTVFLVLSMMPFAAFADNAIVCPACGGEVIKKPYHLVGNYWDFYKCNTCGKWAYLSGVAGLKLLSAGDQAIINAADANAILNFSFNNGHLIPAEKAPSGIGRKDLPGYADDNGTPTVSHDGELICYSSEAYISSQSGQYGAVYDHQETKYHVSKGGLLNWFGRFVFVAPVSGYYYAYVEDMDTSVSKLTTSTDSGEFKISTPTLDTLTNTVTGSSVTLKTDISKICVYASKGDKLLLSTKSSSNAEDAVFYVYSASIRVVADDKPVKKNSITFNNNTWNGNIYVDNSNNLTYIYPQYTTINEKNETVTNISTNPIIYNNQEHKYYTYDTVTNNFYYISYGTSDPSATPTPKPTFKPGGGSSRGGGVGRHHGDDGTSDEDWYKSYYILNDYDYDCYYGNFYVDNGQGNTYGKSKTRVSTTAIPIADGTYKVTVPDDVNWRAWRWDADAKVAVPVNSDTWKSSMYYDFYSSEDIIFEFRKIDGSQIKPKEIILRLDNPTIVEYEPGGKKHEYSPDPIYPDEQSYIIPQMNSNTFTDSHGTWIASGSTKYGSSYDYFMAFDRSSSTGWCMGDGSGGKGGRELPCYVQITIPDPQNYYINGYVMRGYKAEEYPGAWILQASIDGTDWEDLDTQTAQDLSDFKEHSYSLDVHKAYKYYRMKVTAYPNNYMGIGCFNLLGYNAEDVIIPTPSPSPTPAPTDPPTPIIPPSPGGDNPGGSGSGSGSGSGDNSWNPFKWLTDLLKDIVETILKGLWKLLTSIFGFILWLLSLLFKLFPWMPNSGILALCAGVVVVTVIRIIKFITGR